MSNRIIVAHPGRQHSFKLASALKKSGDLLYYCTTIYDKEDSVLMKTVKKILSKDNLKRANGRRNRDLLDSEVVQYCQFGGLIEALLSRMDKKHEVYRMVQRWDAKRFGIKVAKLAMREKADAVIMYDTNSLYGFKYLAKKAPGIKRIQDVSIVPRPYMKKIYQKEIEHSGHNDLKKENLYLWNDSRLKEIQEEIQYTQFFLSASQFVKKGLQECGALEEQIKIVPYGANVESSIIRNKLGNSDIVEFLFVGQVTYRKGITYLLEAMEQIGDLAHLNITGAYNADDWFVKKYIKESNIKFTGLVTQDQMKKIYEKANVFVIPSFAEGMAQVGIEAMACGLPIICTFNSGVADLVEDGMNGFVIPCGDTNALIEKMRWFMEHKDKIHEMGHAAKLTAQNYTWSNYEKNVVGAIHEILDM